ncbi:MAG: anti-phage dCTP deaminase [Gemmatimonadales bacterium]
MSDLLKLEAEKPELVIGIVAAIGTPIESVEPYLNSYLGRHGYRMDTIRVSDFLKGFTLQSPEPDPAAEMYSYERLTALMDRGDELRRVTKRSDALALLVAARISALRPETEPQYLNARAFFVRQLKHPDEVFSLRAIYGDAFHLIGFYSSDNVRRQNLAKYMKETQAAELMARDEGEKTSWGQQLRSAFHLADVFVEMRDDSSSTLFAKEQLDRFMNLLFGEGVITPTIREYGMYLAQAAALRSGDLSRQVGAAILNDRGDVVSLGCNEVPASGGGQYWAGDADDFRDLMKGEDSNDTTKLHNIAEILSRTDQEWSKRTPEEKEKATKDLVEKLDGTRVMNLTEFGRAVHAEVEAILSAARRGAPVKGATLCCTTFPCHNCAKHIVDAGIKQVFYIEPYEKSMAKELHGDSIAFVALDEQAPPNKVLFSPFVGISPRRYSVLFSMTTEDGRRLRRKHADGTLNREPFGLRLRSSALSYIGREAVAALEAKSIGDLSPRDSRS